MVRILCENNSLALYGNMNCVSGIGYCIDSKVEKKERKKRKKGRKNDLV